MARYAVLDEYENGYAAIRGYNQCFVRTSDGDEIEMGSSAVVPNERRTRLYAALCVQLGPIPLLDDPGIVPIEVAAAGKLAIASYIFAAHGEEIGFREIDDYLVDELNVSSETLTKYYRRVLNQVEDEKSGGKGR